MQPRILFGFFPICSVSLCVKLQTPSNCFHVLKGECSTASSAPYLLMLVCLVGSFPLCNGRVVSYACAWGWYCTRDGLEHPTSLLVLVSCRTECNFPSRGISLLKPGKEGSRFLDLCKQSVYKWCCKLIVIATTNRSAMGKISNSVMGQGEKTH